jgi:hypothetical protein
LILPTRYWPYSEAPLSEHPEVEAIETVGGVITDLVEVAERLPVQPGQSEQIARILDRLSEEIAAAAGQLRAAAAPGFRP